MTREDALKRLQQCRDNQHLQWQIIVSADIVDALLERPSQPTDDSPSRMLWRRRNEAGS